MKEIKRYLYKEGTSPVDHYLQCLSYCDIHPKGIDHDCEIICVERNLKDHYC